VKTFDLIFKLVILIAGLIFIVVSLIPMIFGTSTQPIQYEYRVESPSDYSFQSDMNSYGKDGWQLVFARRASSGSGYSATFGYEVILMRKK
jgi:hypothetical protein